MEAAVRSPETSGGRRYARRRAGVLAATLLAVSAAVWFLGAALFWPLFFLPLLLGAVFFLELGGLAVTFWLGNFFVLYYSFRAPALDQAVLGAVLGTALFLVSGLILGRVLRRHQTTQAELTVTCLTDRLTGLYNYGTFVDYLHNDVIRAQRYGGELSLIMLDIDHFKDFNDRHGHELGNELLRRVGATLRASVREADVAARYGGEEFAVLLRGDVSHGHELAERLLGAFRDISVPGSGGEALAVTVSAGVAAYPAGAADEHELLELADRALYESKRRGRDRVTAHVPAPADEVALSA